MVISYNINILSWDKIKCQSKYVYSVDSSKLYFPLSIFIMALIYNILHFDISRIYCDNVGSKVHPCSHLMSFSLMKNFNQLPKVKEQ